MTPDVLQGDEILAAVREAYEDGAVDDLEGGVPQPEIARRVGRDRSSDRFLGLLSRLVEEGDLVKVWGINPETSHSRTSYLPPEALED